MVPNPDHQNLPLPPGGRRVMARLAAWFLVPGLLGGLLFAQARLFREATCETYDEFTYLRMGIRIFRYGDVKSMASPMTPPLPIVLEYALPSLRATALPEGAAYESEVPALIRQARVMTSVLVGMPLVWAVYAWLALRRGWVIGALGGGLVAFSPTVLAAASIATTDACFALFAVVALAVLREYQVRPSRRSFVTAGVGLGLALAAKQSAVVLAPAVLLELLLKSPAPRPGWTRVDAVLAAIFRLGTRFAGLVAIAFTVDWGLYGFGCGPSYGGAGVSTTIPIVIPMVANLFPGGEAFMDVIRRSGPPLAYDTFMGQIQHATEGHPAFLMGLHSRHGWWYFFPVAIVVKSTPAELLMFGLAAALVACPGNWLDPTRRLWTTSLAAMIGMAMCSSINIGQRYVLLAYPLVILLSADGVGSLRAFRPRLALAAGTLLLASQAASAVGIAPHYLGYFNSLCGGPSRGYRYLVDSSLDWGQGLPALRRALEARGYHKVALTYFGTAKPDVYGIRSVPYPSGIDPVASGCDWLAISATHLQGAYGSDSNMLHHFQALPSTLVAHSIFLYDLKDPRVREAMITWRAFTHFTPGAPAPPPAEKPTAF